MAGAIKLFRNARKFYRKAGILTPSKLHPHPFNVKTTSSLVSTVLLLLSLFGYFLFEADSINEYGKGFISSVAVMEALAYFVVNLSKIKSILKLNRKFDGFIGMSELMNHLDFEGERRLFKKKLCKIGANANNSTSTIMYKKLIRKIEKFSKLLYRIVMGSIIYGFLLPPIGLGLINYYVLDKQDESFELPTPMM